MGRFKVVDYSARFLPVDLSRQLLPGTFEFALHHLLEHELDLSEIESRYCNDEVGASAYEPRILLKIVLLGLRTRYLELARDGSGLPRQRAVHCAIGRCSARSQHAGALCERAG